MQMSVLMMAVVSVLAIQVFGIDVSRYQGRWYEQMRDRYFIFENGDCSRALYQVEETGVSVTNSERRQILWI